MVETCHWDASGSLTTGCALPSPERSLVVPAFDEAAALIRIEGDDRVNDVTPLTIDMKDPLAVKVDAEVDCDLQDILHSDAIEDRSRFLEEFSAIQ